MEKIIHSFSTLNLHGPHLQVLDLQRYGAHATRNLKLVRITGSSHHFSGQGSSNTLTDCPRSSSQFLDKWMDAPSTQHNLQVVNMLQTGSVSSVLAREMNAGLVGIRHKGFSDVVLRKPFSEAVCFKGRSNGPNAFSVPWPRKHPENLDKNPATPCQQSACCKRGSIGRLWCSPGQRDTAFILNASKLQLEGGELQV